MRSEEKVDEKKLMEGFEAIERNNKYIAEKYDELVKKFGGKVIAVSNGVVKSHGKTTIEVIRDLERNRIDPITVVIEYIPEKGQIILF